MFQSFQCYYLREDLFILRIKQIFFSPPGNSLKHPNSAKDETAKKQMEGDIWSVLGTLQLIHVIAVFYKWE